MIPTTTNKLLVERINSFMEYMRTSFPFLANNTRLTLAKTIQPDIIAEHLKKDVLNYTNVIKERRADFLIAYAAYLSNLSDQEKNLLSQHLFHDEQKRERTWLYLESFAQLSL